MSTDATQELESERKLVVHLEEQIAALAQENQRLRILLKLAKEALEEVDFHHRARFSGTTEDQVRGAIVSIDAALEGKEGKP